MHICCSLHRDAWLIQGFANMALKERQKRMEEERAPVLSFVKTLLYSMAAAFISAVYRCLLGSLAARVSFNLFNRNETTMVISSDSSGLPVEQLGQKDKDEMSLDAEWEEEDGSDEIMTPSEGATEGRDSPCINTVEVGGPSQHTESPRTMVQLDIWSPQQIPYHVLAGATNNFSHEMMLGRGGFGPVYRGFLVDLGVDVAIKKLSERSQQGLSEYMAEVKIITQVRHRNLVKLIGWCHEQGELLLVYEFLPNGSLDRHLFGDPSSSDTSLLDWPVRYKVAVGLANALTYLHDECDPYVLHRDVKSGNVLLDSKFNTKLADFGLARHFSVDDSSVRVSCPVGTRGYWAPEYALRCRASKRSDVYSFGVVALEIACGKRAILVMEGGDMRESEVRLLVDWVWELHGKGSILDAADGRLNGGFDQLQMERLLMVGLWCAQPDPRERPSMRQAGNALLFPETTSLPDLPRMAVIWAHAVASVRMPVSSSTTLPLISDDDLTSSNSGDGSLNIYPKLKAHVKPRRRFRPRFTAWWTKRTVGNQFDYMKDAQEIATDLRMLRAATGNFSELNLLGQGEFALVYKGLLPNGQEIAVKRLRPGFGRVEMMMNEVALLAKLQHPNLVRLLGVCLEGEEKLLVYEYVPNRSLDKFLFDPAQSHQLNWETRYKIICGIARGLKYLHEVSQVKIIHTYVNPSNVLLDAEMNSKISGFGLEMLFFVDQTPMNTTLIMTKRAIGTFGYIAPECVMTGHYSSKSDVFSFGVLVLTIVTGRRIIDFWKDHAISTNLLTHVWEHWRSVTVLEVVDSSLSGRYLSSEVLRCVQICLLCAQEALTDRPTMKWVVLALSSESMSLPVPRRPTFVAETDTADEESTAMSVIYSTSEMLMTELDPR